MVLRLTHPRAVSLARSMLELTIICAEDTAALHSSLAMHLASHDTMTDQVGLDTTSLLPLCQLCRMAVIAQTYERQVPDLKAKVSSLEHQLLLSFQMLQVILLFYIDLCLYAIALQ